MFFLHWIYGAFTGLFIPVFRRAFGLGVEVIDPEVAIYCERAAS
jgi:hypothetical protein